MHRSHDLDETARYLHGMGARARRRTEAPSIINQTTTAASKVDFEDRMPISFPGFSNLTPLADREGGTACTVER
jgi:hypothetical protein